MTVRVAFTIVTFLFLISPLFHEFKISANNTKSYLVTGYREITSETYLTTVIDYKYSSFPWKSGKVVLSGSPDGTSDLNIGWKIDVTNTKNPSAYFSFNNTDEISTCVDRDIRPLNITHLLSEGDNTLLIRFIKPCYVGYKTQNIGPVYIVHLDDYEPSDMPFLDLPWDYASSGNNFENAALRVSAYFDHEYPLISSGLREPSSETDKTLVSFFSSSRNDLLYSSHDGYDWSRAAGASFGKKVLASASGWATYHSDKFKGNAIYIDHTNGYQTRYYHLSSDGLVTKTANKTWVSDRQEIGMVGFTGNVQPAGSRGAHIHFMVIKDKNGDGLFDDNIPDGIVDPFGWSGNDPDPWPSYNFLLGKTNRSGIKSTYLWKKPIVNVSSTLTTNGGKFYNNASRLSLDIPAQTVSRDLILDTSAKSPVVKPTISGTIDNALSSIGNIASVKIRDGFDNLISTLLKPISIIFGFQEADLLRIKTDTLSIYSSQDGINWQKETTTINTTTKQATAKVNHLTYFALMGARIDPEPPQTTMEILGTKNGDYYTTSIQITLTAIDLPTNSGSGVLYTSYSINDDIWTKYTNPIILLKEGKYQIEYFSEDMDGNVETAKQEIVNINFSPPTPTTTVSATPTPTTFITATTIHTNSPTTNPTSSQSNYTPTLTVNPSQNKTSQAPNKNSKVISKSQTPTSYIKDQRGEVQSAFSRVNLDRKPQSKKEPLPKILIGVIIVIIFALFFFGIYKYYRIKYVNKNSSF